MPVQRCSNAINTHYKALSCDYGSMLIKELLAELLNIRGQRKGIKRLYNYRSGMCVCDAGVKRVYMCVGMSMWFSSVIK